MPPTEAGQKNTPATLTAARPSFSPMVMFFETVRSQTTRSWRTAAGCAFVRSETRLTSTEASMTCMYTW